METVNPNLKSCLNDKQVVVKSKATKVVDKSRQTTLISPNVEGAKKKPFKSTNKKAASASNLENITPPVAQNFPNINPVVQNMLPHQAIHPPPHAFPVLPAGASPIVDPVTQQVYLPAFIPVPSGSAGMSQPLTYLTPFGTQQIEHSANLIGPQLREINEKESNRLENADDKYHSSELDYFLGGTAQYLNEKSQRKRSRSFSNHSSSTYRKSDSGTRKRRRRYSQRSESRNSYRSDRSHRISFPSNRSHSYRSYDRYESQRSRNYSSHSGSRPASIHGSRLYSRSPSDRSFSRSRSKSPPRSGSYRMNSGSRSPVSENSFVGSFLTVSEANSRDSVRSRSRERSRSRSHLSDVSYHEEYYSDIDSVTGNVRDYRYIRNSDLHGGRSSLSPIPDRYWDRPHDPHRHSFRHVSPDHRRDPLRHRPPSNERGSIGRDYERDRYDPHSRYHSDRVSRPERSLENKSELENVSDFEEISELEEISDSDTSIIWKEINSRPQSPVSGTYYEEVSDTEEPLADDATVEKTDIAVSLDVNETAQEVQYDGYLDPRIEKTPKEKNELEEVSDSEIQINDSQSPVKVKTVSESEENTISATAASFIQDVLSGLTSNNAKEDLNTEANQPLSGHVVSQDSGVSDSWHAITNSAVQVYANLGLVKDENNKLIYIGQGNTNKTEQDTGSTIVNEGRNIAFDECLQGYVKTLWQFPHTGVLHMNYANFVFESEAYKNEFIAEVIHIILGLDLPYVTLNKLRNAVREKIRIQLSSVEELRLILALYPKQFILRQHSGSDSEEEADLGMQSSVVCVNLKVEVRLCEKHRALPYSKEVCPCNALHICPFYLLTKCNKTECPLGHDLKTAHNVEVITEYGLHRSTLLEIVEYLRNAEHRMVDTVPAVCKFYNRRRGCAKESETDNDDMCFELHLCFFYAVDSCRKGNDCELSHDITNGQPFVLLQKFGLDPNEIGEFNVLSLIRTFMRTRRSELETLHEKLSDKSLSENEIKLCIARGINPKLLQMTKNLKGQQYKGGIGEGNILDAENTDLGNKEMLPNDDSGTRMASDEQVVQKSHSTLSLQMKAQKALIEKALRAKDEGALSVIEKTDQKAVIPIICKFYNNETGCARSNETCEFIHICHHFVMGDCKYFDRCKRSHDLTSGQPESILTRLGLVNKTEDEIIEVLRKLCGETLIAEESSFGTDGGD